MGFGALRSILRPVSRTLLSAHCTGSSFSLARTPAAASGSSFFGGGCPLHRDTRQMPVSSAFHSLTDNRFPKRRPSDKPRRKRASLRPPGPYAWVKCVPGEPILPNQPNEGSVKRRNEKKRMRQRRAFILAEAKKRKAQLQEANRKKIIKRVERKMAAVARDRAWAEKLAELQRLEEEKKKKVMA
ncbi:hypothetical protein RHGRI_023695 [Rhododendron griersonianum]|uniref:Uncharacterized protein n=1 Tax=Rhododendron griersonianum TaxID=479676 RepID=A0AAV6J6I0_9ERIC|nr:hypothetical protein RHGRI_023695 [Rhododendron griersonianum]